MRLREGTCFRSRARWEGHTLPSAAQGRPLVRILTASLPMQLPGGDAPGLAAGRACRRGDRQRQLRNPGAGAGRRSQSSRPEAAFPYSRVAGHRAALWLGMSLAADEVLDTREHYLLRESRATLWMGRKSVKTKTKPRVLFIPPTGPLAGPTSVPTGSRGDTHDCPAGAGRGRTCCHGGSDSRRSRRMGKLAPCQTRTTRRVRARHLGRRHSSRCDRQFTQAER